jgi:hypothetical protein
MPGIVLVTLYMLLYLFLQQSYVKCVLFLSSLQNVKIIVPILQDCQEDQMT